MPLNLDRTVRERQPVVTELNSNASAITYWVSESDGWHVVDHDRYRGRAGWRRQTSPVVRFSSVLLPGQSQLISVPFATGEQQQVLRIRRLADRIRVARVPGPPVGWRGGGAGYPQLPFSPCSTT